MADTIEPITPLIDLSPDNENDAGAKVDAATDVAAASVAFNSASLPPDMPEWKRSAIRADAAEIVQGIRDDEFRIADVKQREEDAQDNIATMAQTFAAQREREWDRSQVSIGKITMSGQDWDDAYELLSDPDLRDHLIEKVMRNRGWSQTRAEKAADDALTLAQIAQKKKDGTITSADEAKADEITSRNPDAAVMVKEAAQRNRILGVETRIDQSTSTQARLSGDIEIAAMARKEAVQDAAMDEDGLFSSAPTLAAHFDAARTEVLVSNVGDTAVKPLTPRPTAPVGIDGPY